MEFPHERSGTQNVFLVGESSSSEPHSGAHCPPVGLVCLLQEATTAQQHSALVLSWITIGGWIYGVCSDPLECVRAARKACGDVFTIRLITEQVTFLVGPKPHAAFSMLRMRRWIKRIVYKFMTPIFGPGVVYDAPIEQRRQQMRALGAALKPVNLRAYPEIIAKVAKKYFNEKLGENEGVVDIHHMFADLIIKTGSSALMGPEISNELFEEMYQLYQDLDKGLTPLSVFFPYAPTEAHRKRDNARRSIGKLFERIIDRRVKEGNTSKYNDIVQRLMDFSYSDGSKFTGDQIAEMRDSEPEDNMYREGRGIDHFTLVEQPFLHACIKEAIRMFPPIIFLMRRAMQNIPLGDGKHIPQGHMVMVSNAVAQRLGEVFENPDKYEPERWATFDMSKLPKYSFIGFGAGLHTCMGESFAFLQVRTILNVLLSSYELELTTPFPTPDYEAMVVMPHGPNMVRYRKRAAIPEAEKKTPKPARTSTTTTQTNQPKPAVESADSNNLQKYTKAEVALHNKRDDLWIIVNNHVYDITNYIHLHQGGEPALLRVAGKDATREVEGPQHPGTVPTLLTRFEIGVIVGE
ncbi:hypothetical protein BASA81_011322 [Batrachochytrium salamandrivorans]|nr:hypothetical protein BASA81_011322 [Batrachochytrium salamandrivorans]